tara:strand:- start:102 stop:917 length:816 start_codon:yes stop_codon:yes gene_type:complete
MKICIVGYGSIGKRHHRVLSEIFRNTAEFKIVDINTEVKIDDVVEEQFNILVICTPSSSHLEIASKFKNISDLIFIEKPLDTSIKKIVKYRSKIDFEKVHVGCNIRFTEACKNIKKISKNSRIINVVSMSYLPQWRPGSDHLKSYSANKSQGGGVVLDFIHEPDYVMSILGLPVNYKNFEKKIFDNITNDSSDSAFITWEYENKLVNFCLSYSSKEYVRHFECVDNNGHIHRQVITLNDIENSYIAQWEHIIKNGPTNTYDDATNLLKILL